MFPRRWSTWSLTTVETVSGLKPNMYWLVSLLLLVTGFGWSWTVWSSSELWWTLVSAGLSHIIETRKVLDLRIDLKPSYLLIPKSGFYSSMSDLIIIDSGSLQVGSYFPLNNFFFPTKPVFPSCQLNSLVLCPHYLIYLNLFVLSFL